MTTHAEDVGGVAVTGDAVHVGMFVWLDPPRDWVEVIHTDKRGDDIDISVRYKSRFTNFETTVNSSVEEEWIAKAEDHEF